MKRTTILLSGLCCLLMTSSCKKSHRDPLTELRNNWYSFILTEIPGYHFTGIESPGSVVVPVTNNTDYTLDEVVVSVNYIGEAGNIHRSEQLKVFNIPPHSIKTIKAPSAPNGTDLDLEIRNIMSKQMQFIYPGSSTNATDPYFFN